LDEAIVNKHIATIKELEKKSPANASPLPMLPSQDGRRN
jgi:hypothetical protein